MLRILFDDQAFDTQKFGGVSRYFAELISGLTQNPEFRVLPKKFVSKNGHLSEKNLVYFPRLLRSRYFRGRDRLISYLTEIEKKKVRKILKGKNFDIFHPTYYDDHFIDLIGEKPFVLTVHDMIRELYYNKMNKEVHEETLLKHSLIPKAAKIIAVSEYTKRDILQLFPELSPEKIKVVYHGSSLQLGNSTEKIDLPGNYFLFVGQRGNYKNFEWLLKSIGDYLTKTNRFLVCTGGTVFSKEELVLIEELDLKKKVLYIEGVDDKILGTLYSKSVGLIFPSLYEGFGIPIVEAFSCGCPVILSSESCFPEIGGNAAAYFSLANPESLLEVLARIDSDPEFTLELKKKGFERSKMFSWKSMIEDHIAVYKEVLNIN